MFGVENVAAVNGGHAGFGPPPAPFAFGQAAPIAPAPREENLFAIGQVAPMAPAPREENPTRRAPQRRRFISVFGENPTQRNPPREENPTRRIPQPPREERVSVSSNPFNAGAIPFELPSLLTDPKALADRFRPRINQLSFPQWQQQVYGLIFLLSYNRDTAYKLLKDPTHSPEHAVLKLLQRLEKKERLSLLELAVWKAHCLNSTSNIASYIDFLRWSKTGWKEVKQTQKNNPGIDIVVQNVAVFLDGEVCSSSTTGFFSSF